MVTNKDIHNFAIKHHTLFTNSQVTVNDVLATFVNECKSLGFYGETFHDVYTYVNSRDVETLATEVEDIRDPQQLGSIILSKWMNITQNGKDNDLLSFDNRKWFILAFTRLVTITDKNGENPFVFKGKLQKIRLVSNNICYGKRLTFDDEVEQRLSITSGKGIWLMHYCGDGNNLQLIRKEKIPVEEKTIQTILDVVGRSFQEYDDTFVTDVGLWIIELTNSEGKTMQVSGSLTTDSFHGLSNFIRKQLDRNDLYLFDGNPNCIVSVR